MKKMIWILIMIILMITGCNKKDDEIEKDKEDIENGEYEADILFFEGED